MFYSARISLFRFWQAKQSFGSWTCILQLFKKSKSTLNQIMFDWFAFWRSQILQNVFQLIGSDFENYWRRHITGERYPWFWALWYDSYPSHGISFLVRAICFIRISIAPSVQSRISINSCFLVSEMWWLGSSNSHVFMKRYTKIFQEKNNFSSMTEDPWYCWARFFYSLNSYQVRMSNLNWSAFKIFNTTVHSFNQFSVNFSSRTTKMFHTLWVYHSFSWRQSQTYAAG